MATTWLLIGSGVLISGNLPANNIDPFIRPERDDSGVAKKGGTLAIEKAYSPVYELADAAGRRKCIVTVVAGR